MCVSTSGRFYFILCFTAVQYQLHRSNSIDFLLHDIVLLLFFFYIFRKFFAFWFFFASSFASSNKAFVYINSRLVYFSLFLCALEILFPQKNDLKRCKLVKMETYIFSRTQLSSEEKLIASYKAMYFPLYSHFNAFTLKNEAELLSGKLVKPCVHFNNREKRGMENWSTS